MQTLWIWTIVLCASLAPAQEGELGAADVRAAGRVAGLEFEPRELELMLEDVREALGGYARVRALELGNEVQPAFRFDPVLPGMEALAVPVSPGSSPLPEVERPADLATLCFADIPTLAGLVHSRKVSCFELTETFLARLRRVDASIYCVVSYTEERALAQARALDAELDAGKWRGVLHGIPYGAKDLLAARGAPTTWGAAPYAEQSFDFDATVIERLDAAGAVLIAKLSLGSLAMGDEWFAARTRNPWKTEQGSSGSSAGPAAAVVAGGVAFAIGSETLGSIVSPSDRCGTSSIRPTFGRVPRGGAMTLSWTMDKLGPMARSVEDAAIVLAAIHGADAGDADSVTQPFAAFTRVEVEGLRVGVPREWLEGGARSSFAAVLDDLRALGCELVPVDVPDLPVWELMTILTAEAAAAFDALTREGTDDELVRQTAEAWPTLLRAGRLIPAVEYVQASRVRTLLMRRMDTLMSEVDALVHPSRGGPWLGITNLTGHPTIVAPTAPREDDTPTSVSFTGRLYDESRLVALAARWQHATTHHLRRPELPPATREATLAVIEAPRSPWSETPHGRIAKEVFELGAELQFQPIVVQEGTEHTLELDAETRERVQRFVTENPNRPFALIVTERIAAVMNEEEALTPRWRLKAPRVGWTR